MVTSFAFQRPIVERCLLFSDVYGAIAARRPKARSAMRAGFPSGKARSLQHVGDQRRGRQAALPVSDVRLPYAEMLPEPQQARAGPDFLPGDGLQIANLHLHGCDSAQAAKVPVDRDANGGIGEGSQHSAVERAVSVQ